MVNVTGPLENYKFSYRVLNKENISTGMAISSVSIYLHDFQQSLKGKKNEVYYNKKDKIFLVRYCDYY